jgi:hypothetical protein
VRCARDVWKIKNAEARYIRRRVIVKKKSSQDRAAVVENMLKSCEQCVVNLPTISTLGLSTEIFRVDLLGNALAVTPLILATAYVPM